jgi:gas vesicle protein
MADEVSTTVRSIVDKVLEADVKDQIARRGREIADVVTEATDTMSARAAEAWRDSAPSRREAEKAMRKASREAMGWSRRTWARELRPVVRRAWSRRAIALGAAGAAIPAGREIVEDAAVRLGIRKKTEERHWAAFFLGLVLGALAGAAVALLTAPKPGREMRDELTEKAKDAAEKAREVAEGAGEWVPLFQRTGTDGHADEAEATIGEPASAVDAAVERTQKPARKAADKVEDIKAEDIVEGQEPD